MQLGINMEMLKCKFEEKKKKIIALVKCWQITGGKFTTQHKLHNYHQTYFMLPVL